MKLVSVISPAYNAQKYICRAIESILAQDYAHHEIIVVDDGSNDGTKGVCDNYRDKIHYIYQENKGVSSARNRGIREANGEYICFLDADDYYLPNKLSDQIKSLELYPDASASCAAYWLEKENGLELAFPLHSVLDDGSEIGIIPDIFKYYKNTYNCFYTIHMNSIMNKSEVFKRVGLFNEKLHFGEDIEIGTRISAKYDWVYIDKPATDYNRISTTSVTLNSNKTFINFSFLWDEHLMLKEMRPNLHRSYRAFRQEWYWNLIRTGIYHQNLEYAEKGLSLVWTPPFNLRFLMFLVLKFSPSSWWPTVFRFANYPRKIFNKKLISG
jgi:glycosyltransferase involved in cell wall biosynthesis